MKEYLKQLVVELRMECAFIRQYLRDNEEKLPQNEIDALLDKLGSNIKLIKDLEKEIRGL